MEFITQRPFKLICYSVSGRVDVAVRFPEKIAGLPAELEPILFAGFKIALMLWIL